MPRRQDPEATESDAGHRAPWLRPALSWTARAVLWPLRFTLAALARGGALSLIGFAALPVGVYLLAGPGWAVLMFALSCVLADAFVIGDPNDEAST